MPKNRKVIRPVIKIDKERARANVQKRIEEARERISREPKSTIDTTRNAVAKRNRKLRDI